MKKSVSVDMICSLLILLFMYAAISKLLHYDLFRAQLGQSPILNQFAGELVWGVPGLEIGLSLCLAIQKFRVTALYASFGLMVMFTAYIFTLLHYSEYVPCSCGGILQNFSWNQHIMFNIFFILISAMGVILSYKSKEAIRIGKDILLQ